MIYVSKDEALAKGERMFGEFGKTLTDGFADSNPFPASLEIYIRETLLPPENWRSLLLNSSHFLRWRMSRMNWIPPSLSAK